VELVVGIKAAAQLALDEDGPGHAAGEERGAVAIDAVAVAVAVVFRNEGAAGDFDAGVAILPRSRSV
jgi:hypothetical protein